MTGEMFVRHEWLWPLVWQSTTILALGLAGSFIWRRRPVRAHQFLLMALLAAAVVPALTHVVKQRQWGLLTSKPTEVRLESDVVTPMDHSTVSQALPRSETEAIPMTAAPSSEIPRRSVGTIASWTQLVLPLWIAVSTVLLARLAIRLLLAYHLAKQSIPLDAPEINRAIETAKAKLGIRSDVRVRSSRDARSPVIWCWAKTPKLLVPDTTEPGSDIDWQSVIYHELAHWKRRDHLSGFWAELIVCALPWNPLSWWAKHSLIGFSEEACDDWVIASGQTGTRYARTLLTLTPREQTILAPAVVTSKKGLGTRIRRILADQCASPHSGLKWTAIAVLIVGLVTLGIAFAQTRPAAPQTKSPDTQEQPTMAPSIPARAVEFPPDRPCGTLFVRDPDATDWYSGWVPVGPAQGRMQIPAGKQARLEANKEAAVNLSFLAQLAPNDLQMLDFDWKRVAIASLEPIGSLTGLRALNLQRTQFDSAEFRYLTGLSQLEVLRFGDYDLDDDSMQYLGQLKSLRSLALWGTGISDEGLRHLRNLANLTFLALNNCDITDQGLRYLEDMTALEGLQISDTKITDHGLVHLQHLVHLKHIKLEGNGITDTGLRRLETLRNLDNIWINRNPITDDGLATLARMRHLLELYAYSTQVTDAGLAHLRGLPEFWHVSVAGIGDEGVAHLSSLPAMRMIQIQDARITEASVASFQAMPALKKLLVSGDSITDDLLDALREALPNCKVWDPQRARQDPMPAWRERFEAVYRLEANEILKRIAPPFILERMDFYRNDHGHQAEAIPRGPDTMMFHWAGKLKNWGMSFGRVRSLAGVLNGVVRLRSYEYEGPRDLLRFEMPGDWIVRDDAPPEDKLRALETLMEAEFDRKVRFEKRQVEREVVIATGRFEFHPPVGTDENDSVHIYADRTDTDGGSGGGSADSPAEFLEAGLVQLGDRINIPVIDRTEPTRQMRIRYRCHRSSAVGRERDPQARARQLRLLLDHLTEQTELKFDVESQSTSVWFVTEEQ